MAYTYRCEYVHCRKAHCSGCPHGPYWYGYERQKGKLHKKYFGKRDPRPGAQERPQETDIPIWCRTSMDWCCAVLGVTQGDSRQACVSAYNSLALKHHPDRGGNTRQMARVNHAWGRLRELKRLK